MVCRVSAESGAGAAPSQTRIQSVSRAIRILKAVASSDEGLTVRAATEELELSTPTAYHLLNTLVDEGMLVKDERRRYLLGPSASVIAEAFNRQGTIPERYMTALNGLASSTRETAYLSAWRNGAIAVLASVEGSQAVRVAGLTAGYSENEHARASGKLLLAFASDEVREAVLARSHLRRVTPHTITSMSALKKEFTEIRSSGIAFDREEFRERVTCAAAAITENGAVVACLTVSSPSERFAQNEREIIEHLRKATEAASSG
jgi:DNA-binding IclR family transcriptional regulator